MEPWKQVIGLRDAKPLRKLRIASDCSVPPAPWVKISAGGGAFGGEEGRLLMHFIGFLPSRRISKSPWCGSVAMLIGCSLFGDRRRGWEDEVKSCGLARS